MRRVLIVTYYWPPSAGSGVQRWLKFSKYLPENGWKPIIYTPSNPDFDTTDDSLLEDVPNSAEVIQTSIWEPYGLYKQFSSGKGKSNINNGILESNQKKGYIKKILSNFTKWVRGNVFIPDPKVFWVKKSISFLTEYLQENPVDVIVTTGPPHSMHLIGLGLKKSDSLSNIPWVADFRDPWSKLDLLDDYNISRSSRQKYEQLEKDVLQNSDLCLTVSNNWGALFKELGAQRVEVITNGYDGADILENKQEAAKSKFIVSHFGLLNHLRNPRVFWEALDLACSENSDLLQQLEIHIGGTVDKTVQDEIQGFTHIGKRVTMHGYVPHSEVITWYQKSSLLLLLTFNSEIGKGNIPGKLFEYLAMKKPIVAFGHENGDVAEIISESQLGSCFPYETTEINRIKAAILSSFGGQFSADKSHDVSKYKRENLTKRLVTLLNNLSE